MFSGPRERSPKGQRSESAADVSDGKPRREGGVPQQDVHAQEHKWRRRTTEKVRQVGGSLLSILYLGLAGVSRRNSCFDQPCCTVPPSVEGTVGS